MSSPTPIVAPPAILEYMLYGTFGMLCLAITIGVIILIRRQATREQMTGMGEIDYPKIATQLQKEIVRLQELRDRIYPEGIADRAVSETKKSAVTEPGIIAGALGIQGASIASMSAEDLKMLPEVQSLLNAEISALADIHQAQMESEVAALKAELLPLKAKNATAPTSSDPVAAEKFEVEIKGLKDRLQEYEIFEEDLSRVKELTRENIDLRNRLAAAGVTVPAAMSTADAAATLAASIVEAAQQPLDAAQASSANLNSGSTANAQEEFDEGAMEAAVESGDVSAFAVDGETAETDAAQVTAEFEKLLTGKSQSEPSAATVAAVAPTEVPAGFESKKVSEGPSADVASVPADDLMAEFEKLLGSSEKET